MNRLKYLPFKGRESLPLIFFVLLNLFTTIFNLNSGVTHALDTAQLLTNGAIIDSQGNQVVALPNSNTDFYNESLWSADGSKIAYPRTNGFGIVNADGSGNRVPPTNSKLGNFAWSPDSSRIAFANYSRETDGKTFIFKADGSDVKQITGFSGNIIGWKGDSSQLYLYEDSGDYFNNPGGYIKAVNVDGSGQRNLFNISGYLGIVKIWYDGKRIFYSKTENPGIAAEYKYFLVNFDGTGTVEIPGSGSSEYFFSTSGNKALTVYYNFEKGDRLAVMDINDPLGSQKVLSLSEKIIDACWIPDSEDLVAAVLTNGSKIRLDRINSKTFNRTQLFEVPNLIYSIRPNADAGGLYVTNMQIEPKTGLLAFSHIKPPVNANDATTYATYIVDLKSQKTIKVDNKFFYSWRPIVENVSYGSILPEFYQVWKQSDLAIANGQSNKSWLWGPDAFATKIEDYKEAKGGKRQVQYFDKARMELNNPDGDRSSPFFVTNGLLPKELIGGYIQTGDNQNQPKTPAEINVAGDPDGSITYAKLAGVVTLEPGKNTATNKVGQAVTAAIDRNGTVSEKAAVPGVNLTQYISETGHNIPNVFVDYFKTLPQDWVFVMGFPISEPYQTEIILGGKPTLAIIQVFERRVLTYTPSNPDPYKVEQGNVGRHYFQWRYGADTK